MQSSPINKEGSLMMHHSGLMGVSWKPCYFSLQRAYLHIYETKDSSTPIENIVRSSITRAGQVGNPSLFKFEVEFNQRNKMILQATSELEVKQWVHVLMWHLLPADIRNTVPTGDGAYNAPPAYDDVVEEQNNNSHSFLWPCCIT